MRKALVWLVCIFVSGCSTSSLVSPVPPVSGSSQVSTATQVSPSTQPAPPTSVVLPEITVTAEAPAPAETLIPVASMPASSVAEPEQLPAGWTSVVWNDLVLPIPEGRRWNSLADFVSPYPASVIAAGIYDFPLPEGGTRPGSVKTTLLIIDYEGTLESWLDVVEAQNPASSPVADYEVPTIAGYPALRYTISFGSGAAGGFVANLGNNRLLIIDSENIDFDRSLVEHIRRK